jgi:hypothetical protein
MNYYEQIFNLLLEAQGDEKLSPDERRRVRDERHATSNPRYIKRRRAWGDVDPDFDPETRLEAHLRSRGVTNPMKRAAEGRRKRRYTSAPLRAGVQHIKSRKANLPYILNKPGPNLP